MNIKAKTGSLVAIVGHVGSGKSSLLSALLGEMEKINGNVFGGIGVRGYNSTSLDAIIISGGVNFKKNYTLTYSFGTGISELKRVNEGSHEVSLNYNLQKILQLL